MREREKERTTRERNMFERGLEGGFTRVDNVTYANTYERRHYLEKVYKI